jgi:hypothetical protein
MHVEVAVTRETPITCCTPLGIVWSTSSRWWYRQFLRVGRRAPSTVVAMTDGTRARGAMPPRSAAHGVVAQAAGRYRETEGPMRGRANSQLPTAMVIPAL